MIEQAIADTCKLATKLYGVDLSRLITKIEIKGTKAGTAQVVGGIPTMSLSIEACDKYSKEMAEVTIPHELAHIVCDLVHTNTKSHGKEWYDICIALGGTGATTHNMELTPTRKTRKFLYLDTQDEEHTLTIIRHNKLQNGKVASYCVTSTRAQILPRAFIREIKDVY